MSDNRVTADDQATRQLIERMFGPREPVRRDWHWPDCEDDTPRTWVDHVGGAACVLVLMLAAAALIHFHVPVPKLLDW